MQRPNQQRHHQHFRPHAQLCLRPRHQRIKQVVTLSGNAPSNMMGGTTWYMHGDNNELVYEYEQLSNGKFAYKHYLQAAGMTFAMASWGGWGKNQLNYYQQGHLGSIAAVTDASGAVIERMAYDPWGKRRYPNGIPDKVDARDRGDPHERAGV